MLLVGWQEGHPACKKYGGWWRWALVSPDGMAPSWMVVVSASVNLPLHHKVQKFSSGTSLPGWSRKRAAKMVAVVVQYLKNFISHTMWCRYRCCRAALRGDYMRDTGPWCSQVLPAPEADAPTDSQRRPVQSASWAVLSPVHQSTTKTVEYNGHLVYAGYKISSTGILHTTPPLLFCGPFSETTWVSQCHKRTSGLYGARED